MATRPRATPINQWLTAAPLRSVYGSGPHVEALWEWEGPAAAPPAVPAGPSPIARRRPASTRRQGVPSPKITCLSAPVGRRRETLEKHRRNPSSWCATRGQLEILPLLVHCDASC